MSLEIFGVTIDNKQKKEIYQQIDNSLSSVSQKLFIVTLNPEILLKAQKDMAYREMINQADLKIVDGFGIQLLSWLKGRTVGERVTGADLAKDILQKANERGLPIGLVMKAAGWSNQKELQAVLKKWNIKNIDIYSANSSAKLESAIGLDREVLLVGLGAPDQEQLIYQLRKQLPKLRLAIGVGGTFDYWTGRKKRAPKWMQKIGLEWLWRLIIQPNRIFRIIRAVLVFSYKALK